METNINIHVYDRDVVEVAKSTSEYLEIDNAGSTIRYFMSKTQQCNFLDALCIALYDTSFSELKQSFDEAEKEKKEKDTYIEKLENEIEELKAALSPSEDCSDSTELY